MHVCVCTCIHTCIDAHMHIYVSHQVQSLVWTMEAEANVLETMLVPKPFWKLPESMSMTQCCNSRIPVPELMRVYSQWSRNKVYHLCESCSGFFCFLFFGTTILLIYLAPIIRDLHRKLERPIFCLWLIQYIF